MTDHLGDGSYSSDLHSTKSEITSSANVRSRTVLSRNHPLIKQILSLHSREGRESTGLYYIEGVRFVAQAALYNANIESLVVCPPLLTHPFARKLVTDKQQAGTPVTVVSPEVLRTLSLVNDAQGIGAVVHQKWLPLDRVKLRGKLCWVACEALQSPGNLGTILRTCDAVGAAGVIFFGGATDPYDPATVRASMGSLFSQRFVRTTIAEFAAWKEPRRWTLVGTDPSAEKSYRELPYAEPTVLFIGNERKGLSEELKSLCDQFVRISMVGHTDSLNVSVTTAVILYEIFNKKRDSADFSLAG